jgi:hypothetical protein
MVELGRIREILMLGCWIPEGMIGLRALKGK